MQDNVGRCNREIQCGYHYTPKQFFEDTNNLVEIEPTKKSRDLIYIPKRKNIIHTIPYRLLLKSIQSRYPNNFILFLENIFNPETTKELTEKYLIGTSKKWKGATIFWQMDTQRNIRSGKIMLYHPITGKRVKKPFPHISWVHKTLKIKDYHLKQCLFGEHLLKTNREKPIAIVESEKTAIISSVFLSKFIWMATGSLSNLNYKNTKVLKGRQVVLFPDLNGYEKWKEKISTLYPEVDYQISDLIEKKASKIQKEKGWDIADYLLDIRLIGSNINYQKNTNSM